MSPLAEGFYRSDCWPYHFTVTRCTGMEGLFLWGLSIWKNEPGYRTFGQYVSKWQSRYPNAKIEVDHDRTEDEAFLREYRAKMKERDKAKRKIANDVINDTVARLRALLEQTPSPTLHVNKQWLLQAIIEPMENYNGQDTSETMD